MPFTPTDRLRALPPYLFVEIDRKKRELLAAGKDVIDFGVGDPDQPTPDFIVQRLLTATRKPVHHRYPLGIGSAEYRQGIADFVNKRYGVALDPQREILCLIGSKEGIGHLPLAAVNPGDTVLIPDPGYPVYHSATLFAGGVPKVIPLTEERGWLPDLDAIPADLARAAKLLFLNYPNNPTGATATLEFFEKAVAFARKHDILIAQDAAYNETYFDAPPPSILQVAGAKEVAVEFHSLSKTFNMTGWRLGFAIGNADVLAALAKIKSNLDSGAFGAVQEAGIEAYAGINRPEITGLRAMYHERAEVLAGGLRELGFRVRKPAATFYLWTGVPNGYVGMQVVNKALDEAAVVCIPGIGFGQAGEKYVRFALTVPVERTREALTRLRNVKW